MLNSVISTPDAIFVTIDISKIYLNITMTQYEYLKLKLSNIPDKIIKLYNLKEKPSTDGSVYVEIRKGMYGLPQAGLIEKKLLEKRLVKHEYTQIKLVPGILTHKWRPIQFTLVINDFGMKYVGKEHDEHLIYALQ